MSRTTNAPYSSPKGVKDILAPDSKWRRQLLSAFIQKVELAGFEELVLPLFEEAGVFLKVGEATEIVQKQMYDFYDKDERQMVLRPESTAGVMRAYIQHRPTLPWKVWYEGAHFRYEKPQAGRFRQFHQVGLETLGTDDPMADVEIVALGWNFLTEAGAQIKLLVNSLGDNESRAKYIQKLKKYLEGKSKELSEQSKATLEINPLRVLDSKRKADLKIIEAAPLLSDFISKADAEHFAAFCAGLDLVNIPYQVSPRLVRGLDYYTRTTFEYASEDLDSAQSALGGGGRYDGLAEDLGGPACPSVGFAIGIDRTLVALAEPEKQPASPDVFVIDLLDGKDALAITQELRADGISADRAFDGRSMKAQMKLADRSGALFAVIIGEDEKAQAKVSLVTLRQANKTQENNMRKRKEQDLIPREQLVAEIKRRLG